METIDVKGLPEPAVRAIEVLVETLRERRDQTGYSPKGKAEAPRELASVRGNVIGRISREQIYHDIG